MAGEWEADVVVIGGGMAGIGAAIASARSGARTILVERAGWLGGIGITGATGLHS
ncbi:MAG: FAD-dependent oxidoreductase, partial [Planctomycetota bacterium]